jgi:membrane protein implicated in regulation of membrane protease activity
MPYSPDAMRRWFGLLFLALAFGMLVWGQTVLSGKLEREKIVFVIYWFVCFLFVIAAIVTALLDVRATRRRAQREHEELVRRTLEQIDEDQQGEK